MGHVVGVDENGLGPRLGPMIVTAVTARVTEAGHRAALRKPGKVFGDRLGDSKRLVSYTDSSLGEAWARVLGDKLDLERGSPDALVHAMSNDSRETLRVRCPDDHSHQCWGCDEEVFQSTDEQRMLATRDLKKLEKKGIDVVRVEVAIVCTERLNDGVDRGLSRFVLDLHTMERLVLSARNAVGEDVYAACGKVGGYNTYAHHFGPLNGRLHVALVEGRARSEYAIPGVGRIAFVRDADDTHTIVGLASLVGKWVRDLLMARVVRYHRTFDDSLPFVSGYHDPQTAKFVDATALTRKKRSLPDRCFERTALGDMTPSERGS